MSKAKQQEQQRQQRDKKRKDNNSESLLLIGEIEALKPVIPLLVNIQKIIKSKDIGEFVGTPLVEYARAIPRSVDLIIHWASVKTPPYTSSQGNRVIRATYKIPDVDRKKIKWADIKAACGGENGYLWGRFRCTANLNNGRQMAVYGATENEAVQRLRALYEFTKAEITTISVTEEKKAALRDIDKLLHKPDTRVYPAWVIIQNSSKIVNESNRELIETEDIKQKSKTIKTVQGGFKRVKTRKIPLWVNEQPSWFDNVVDEAFIIRGTDNINSNP